MAEQRIQKVLSDQGVCSRRAAEQMIADGRVKVNGHPVGVGDKMDPDFDKVSIDDKNLPIVRKRQYIYLMLNKPRGYITTAADELGRKTVMDLIKDVSRRVYPVGRLDKDSEGLLLLTDDGAFANLLTHPSGGISKLYRVTV
ncbi:MAG: pseudouridine synthase, partial [Gemmiger sp.]|nr:pseudouridine synthase [Gemmiger sp.]